MLGDRLKLSRAILGITLDELTDMYNSKFTPNLPKGTFSKFENSKQHPSLRVINNLSEILGVSVDFLLGRTKFTSHLDNLPVKNTADIRQICRERMVLLGEIGCSDEVLSPFRENYIEIGVPIDADFCLLVRGNDMNNAHIYDGDVVFVKRQIDISENDVCVVVIDDIAKLRRVKSLDNAPSGNIVLVTENYEHIQVKYKKSDIKIVGKVIAFRSAVI